MKNRFLNLYSKELKSSLNMAIVFTIINIGWYIFLFSRKWSWNQELIFGLSFIPLAVLPFVYMLKGFLSIRKEWKEDTIFALLSLPVPGWHITVSKLSSAMTYCLIQSLISVAGIYLVSNLYIHSLFLMVPSTIAKSFVVKFIIGIFFAHLVLIAFNYIVCQFSYIISRLFDRFIGLITGITFLISYWFISRVSNLLIPLFRWLPDFSLQEWGYRNGVYQHGIQQIESAPFIVPVIVVIGLLILSSWLLENVLEV